MKLRAMSLITFAKTKGLMIVNNRTCIILEQLVVEFGKLKMEVGTGKIFLTGTLVEVLGL